MGRPRQFDMDDVLARTTSAFATGGYAGTSIDDLTTATGLQRASLYNAFSSKRGLFTAALSGSWDVHHDVDLDLALVALMELAPHDDEIRQILETQLQPLGAALPTVIGDRLLERARLQHLSAAEERP